MNRLRLKSGFSLQEMSSLTGWAEVELQKKLSQAVRQGLLTERHHLIQVTELGHRFLNDLLSLFL